jgi:hypothetical protein
VPPKISYFLAKFLENIFKGDNKWTHY